MSAGMVGRTYLLRGEPVVVLARWRGNGCPRNVLIERADGTKTVRPFRGLRVPAFVCGVDENGGQA